MLFQIISSSVILILLLILLCKIFLNIKQLIKLNCLLIPVNAEFESLLNFNEYFNHRKRLLWTEKHQSIYNELTQFLNKIAPLLKLIKYRNDNFKNIFTFNEYFKNGETIRKNYNEEFIDHELTNWKYFFDNFESHPLSAKQREAILHDEDNTLVIAGAGTGKTTTLTGKAAFLISRYKVAPEHILLLAFTNNTAKEMEFRIHNKIGVDLDVKTFHKFGIDIIGLVENQKPSPVSDQSDTSKLNEILEGIISDLSQLPEFKKELNKYNIFEKHIVNPFYSYESVELYKNELRLKQIELKTLQGEVVKSYEERLIADFLFVNGIYYKYEDFYKYNTANAYFSQYRPDFYLPDFDLYIEHFGIDEDGNVAPWMKSTPKLSAKEKYNSSIIYKRNLHKVKKTRLVETFSYEHRNGKLLNNLESKLKNSGISFTPRNAEEIGAAVKKRDSIYSGQAFVKLINSFLTLYKSNNFSIVELKQTALKMNNPSRSLSFLILFEEIFNAYQKYLNEKNEIDFSDMIVKATNYIKENKFISPYKYILVDEFQDISEGRYNLIKALVNQNKDVKVFCVGDDWQSIYRFTGSDLFIITNFTKYFGYTKQIYLDITYRFNDQISEFSEKFIQQNPLQLKKNLITVYKSEETAKEIILTENIKTEIENILSRLNELIEPNPVKVFVISRYNYDIPKDIQSIKKKFFNLKLDFLTAHKSKGLEADYVIIAYLNSGFWGFPSEMQNDPILNLVLTEPDTYPDSEERRVFYVAMTRAKKKVFFVAEKKNPSKFIYEI